MGNSPSKVGLRARVRLVFRLLWLRAVEAGVAILARLVVAVAVQVDAVGVAALAVPRVPAEDLASLFSRSNPR